MLRIFMTGFALLLTLLTGISGANAAENEFTGSNSCTSCHAEQQQGWQGSHHDLAMQHATEDTMLGDFNNSEFSANGVRSRFFTRDGTFWVNTDSVDGSMQDFEIKYTFGVTPLQQYLVEFPDGRVQTLGIAWDSRPESAGGQRFKNHPRNQEIIFMLASINRDLGRNEKAMEWAQKLLEINPTDQNAKQFIEMLNAAKQ